MNQQPPWQPQEPFDGQHLYGQQQWKQHLRPPPNLFPPPKRPSGIMQWYQSRTKKMKLVIGCGAILALLLFFSCIGTAVGSVHLATPSAPTPTTSTNQAAVTSPVVRNQPTPPLTPPPHQTPKPIITPTHAPLPTSPPCQATNGNPWCYNFLPGKLIYSPPADFCTYFACIPSFVEPDDPGDGYIVQCRDGLFSQSGGERGACSHHGWVSRSLYSH